MKVGDLVRTIDGKEGRIILRLAHTGTGWVVLVDGRNLDFWEWQLTVIEAAPSLSPLSRLKWAWAGDAQPASPWRRERIRVPVEYDFGGGKANTEVKVVDVEIQIEGE